VGRDTYRVFFVYFKMDKKVLPNFTPYDLGVASTPKKIFLYGNLLTASSNPFFVSESNDGASFKSARKTPSIKKGEGEYESTLFLKDFRISKIGKEFILLYKTLPEANSVSKLARSKNLINWELIEGAEPANETAAITPDFKINNRYVMYYGDKDIHIAYSSDLKSWESHAKVLSPQNSCFDRYPLTVGNVFNTPEGILLFYYVKEFYRDGLIYSIGVALFDKNSPEKLIARSTKPICTQQLEATDGELYPLGIAELKDNLFFYFGVRGKNAYAVSFGKFEDAFSFLSGRTKPRLTKHDKNPIIAPVLRHAWQSDATFNPAAVADGENVHFIYRAMGKQNTSVLGHATSSNGYDVDYLSDKPIYVPRRSFETPGGSPKRWFMSGGGYGGCEDPRITHIKDDKRFYLTYVAYNGANAPRAALSSISEDDFRNKNWNWSLPKLISPPNIVDKNAALFPEKINGKYVMTHRIFPNILIDFLDDLEFKKPRYLKGEYKINPTVDGWDSRKIGAGPPPIKTRDGWLLIYHAVDDKNDSQYKIGAMILDLKEPWKVLYRTHQPILEPDQWYENEGYKPGVVYPCGAVIKNNTLFVYYGGADKFICAASKNLDEFLEELKTHHCVNIENKQLIRPILKHYA